MMKIKSIDIAAFGKFKNYHLDLADGMTVILGENENGKTTIMAFIRMMFYGNTSKSSDIDKNVRIKYRPWNSDLMAGSITFEHEGTLYRLEREFKRSNSTDKINLINLDLNTSKTLSGSEEVGLKFFGLSGPAFEKSIFIGELGAPAKNETADGEINSKLSNMALTGDEDVSFEKISQRLLKAKEALMSKRGKIGKYDKATVELEALNNTIKASKDKEDEIALLEKKAIITENKYNQSKGEASRLFELLKSSDKIKKRNLLEKYIEASREVSIKEDALRLDDGTIADNGFIKGVKDALASLTILTQKEQLLTQDIKALEDEIAVAVESSAQEGITEKTDEDEKLLAEIDSAIEDNNIKSQKLQEELGSLKPKKSPNILLLVLGAVVVLAGVSTLVIDMVTVGIALSAVGAVLFISGFVFKKTTEADGSEIRAELTSLSSKLSYLLEKKQALMEKITAKRQEATALAVKQASDRALLENRKLTLEGKKSALEDLNSNIKSESNALITLCQRFSPITDAQEAVSLIDDAQNALSDLDSARQRLSVIVENIDCSSTEEAEACLKSLAGENISISDQEAETLRERFRAQTDISSKLKSELASIRAEISALTSGLTPTEVLKRQRGELVNKIEAYKDFCEISDLASSVLEEAFRELRRSYSGALDNRTSQILALLTNDKYRSVNVSKNFDISVTTDEAFGLKDTAYLSSGTADQTYLALRLAIAELITEQTGSLPIMLDDALTQYDDHRAKNALAFLKEYSADRQVILFTCHSYFKDIAESISLNTKTL